MTATPPTPDASGGPAFPMPPHTSLLGYPLSGTPGMTLRDYFAAHVQADDRLVKAVRAMDDTALEVFALYPTAERETWIGDTDPIEGQTRWHGMTEVQKVTARLELEAKAIAIVRYMQADAMLRARRLAP